MRISLRWWNARKDTEERVAALQEQNRILQERIDRLFDQEQKYRRLARALASIMMHGEIREEDGLVNETVEVLTGASRGTTTKAD